MTKRTHNAKPKMTLFIKELFSIGAVDSGDNPEAEIVFWKRHKADDDMEGAPMIGEFDLTGLPADTAEALSAYVAKVEAERDAALAAVPVEEIVEKELPAELADLVAKAKADADAARAEAEAVRAERDEVIAKAARDALVVKVRDDKLEALLGAADEVADTLADIAKKAPESYEKLYQNLLAAAQRVELGEVLSKELGSNPGEPAEKTYEERRDEYVAKRLADDGTLTADSQTIIKLRSEFVQLNPDAGRSK